MTSKVNSYSCIRETVIIFLIANSCICFELRITNSLEDQIKFTEPTEVAKKFIDCMRANDSNSCYIYVLKEKWKSHYNDYVDKTTDDETSVVPIYSCSWTYFISYYYSYYIKCQREDSTICNINYDCHLQVLFHIKWMYPGDHLLDTNLSQCLYLPWCTSYAKIRTTAIIDTTTLSTSTLKTKPTVSWQYVTIPRESSTERQYKTPTNISGLNNWNSTSSFDSKHSSNTTIIIIAVILSVCFILATVIVVYCVRKIYISKNTSSTNIYVNDSTVNNNQFISMKNMAPSTLQTTSGDTKQSFQNVNNNNTSKACFNISSNNNRDEKLDNSANYEITPVDDGVYLNTSSSDMIDKAYSRLGEQVRVIAHDYNGLIPEDDNSSRFIDSTTIPEKMKDNASNKTVNTEYVFKQDSMPISDTLTNPYTFAKVVITGDT